MANKKILYALIGIIGVAVFVTFILILRNIGGTNTQNTTLTIWGVYDTHTAFDQVIKNFQIQHPGVKVKYQQVNYDQYEQQLINGLAAGNGPDIFMIHNTWLPKHGDKVAPMPATIPGLKEPLFTIQGYKAQFVDVVTDDLVYQNQIYGVPLYVDTLALYYNKDLFNTAGITRPPQSWEEVNDDAQLLTRKDQRENIVQAGVALGTARNINRSTDILMDMMIQSGTRMTDADNRYATFESSVAGQPVGEIALRYYTDFADPRRQVYSWNNSQHYSIDAFSEGTLGMMFSYSHEAALLRAKAPRLSFAVAPMPQISSKQIRNYANYWSLAVSKTSSHVNDAWQFIAYAASKDGESAYLNATNRPAARRDLIDLQRSDPDLGVFAVQALTAKSWFQADSVAIETIFADMIEDINLNRSTARDALNRANSRVTVLMQK